jgi:colicin import membrane protein
MRTSLAISATGHAMIVLWGVVTFVIKPYQTAITESLPVDIVSTSEFSKIMAGSKNAPQAEKAQPLVEKVGEEKRVDDTAPKVTKREVKATTDTPPAPKPADPKQKTAPAKQEVKPDQIAEALKKDDTKKPEQKKVEAKTPTPPKRPVQQPPQPKFDPKSIAALLDKRDPERMAAAGQTLNPTPTLGLSSGRSAQLSQSELDALRARLTQLWNPPAGASNPEEVVVRIRVKFKPDGTIEGGPMVLSSGQSALFMASRDSAVRALLRGQPFNMLKPENYEQWKDIEITFDPRQMIRG